MTATVVNSLGDSFIQTRKMKEIRMMDWPNDVDEYILPSATLEMCREKLAELVKEFSKEKNMVSKPVLVEVLDLRWFYADRKNFVAFATILTAMPVNFYSSKFTIVLLNYFWDETQKIILWK